MKGTQVLTWAMGEASTTSAACLTVPVAPFAGVLFVTPATVFPALAAVLAIPPGGIL